MPSAKYYRTVLPRDLLQIIGNYAGDETYKLVFTFTPRRRFLGNIEMHLRDSTLYCEYQNPVSMLKPNSWRPVCMNCIAEILVLLGEKCKIPEYILVPSLKRITDILLEVHDYTLRRGMPRGYWKVNK